ncbi:MAG TPA: HDIG domain-containing protein [Bacteroidales bacterium]|nr:HDIG domain-containing protein [Bacteroidales bacterium]HNR42726.1 HDIG domain-containing protein [Bacteroidales bacterium]HPM18684.1 HDIG domain-containing protein [Bacteroidales bacterium]
MAESRRPPEIKPDRKYLFHLAFFIASAIIVVLISPREGKFRYEFQKGKPWLNSSLIAPWDFPVLKPASVIARERDSISRNFTPYFRTSPEISSLELEKFKEYLDASLNDYLAVHKQVPASLKNKLHEDLLEILSEIYRRGILETDAIGSSYGQNFRDVTVINGKIAEKKPFGSFYLQKTAYLAAEQKKEELMNGFKAAADKPVRDFLENVAFYNFIRPNLIFDPQTSSAVRDKMLSEVSPNRGMIQEGELIISRGEIVNDAKYLILESLRDESERRLGMYDKWLVVLGRIILVCSCYMALYLFMYHFRFDVLSSTQKTFFIILIILLFIAIIRLMLYAPSDVVFLVPLPIIPIVIRTFYDSRLALFVYLIAIMLAGFIVPNSFEFVFISYLAGVIVIFSLTNINRRAKLFFTAFMVFLAYSVVYFGIGIMQEGSLENMNWRNYIWFAGNGVLLLLSYPLIFVFEKTFRFLSDATLFELADTNQPLLRKLSENAPGSFQHSLQVANLAEEAAREIGANNLLARTGALYHDIGKIVNAQYFIENQSEGFSPHDRLDPEKSARIIIDHVKEGVELARKHKLPSQIIDFIQTHHGTSVAYYFYKKFLDKNPDRTDMQKNFSYSGPKPFSRETAIVMMADSVEASSRTLPEYTEDKIRDLVERIIYLQEQDGLFSETPLTFRDVTDIKRVFVKRLLNIYHARIAYPAR